MNKGTLRFIPAEYFHFNLSKIQWENHIFQKGQFLSFVIKEIYTTTFLKLSQYLTLHSSWD